MNPGRAEAALGSAVGDPGLLQGMQVLRSADALDGGDLAELVHPFHLLGAGAHHLTVHDDRAGPADAGAAAHFDAGEAHAAENLRQGVLLRVADDEPFDPVDLQAHSCEFHVLFPIP